MIFSGEKPLFNRKYLMALVWLLPVAIVLLSRLGPDDAGIAKSIGVHQYWVESDKPQLTIYLSQGSGLTTHDSARQALLLEGLAQRFDDPQVNELLYQQGWRVKPQGSSLYTAINISAAQMIDSAALARLIELLKQPPAIDWTPIIERLTAEAYLASQNGRQRALNGLLSPAELQLTARTYIELVDQPMYLLFQTPELPQAQVLASHTELSAVQPGKSAISVRSKTASTLSLWQMPAPQSTEAYLAQQVFGLLVSQQLAALPDTRIQQQLSPQGSLLLIETTAEAEALSAQLSALLSKGESVEQAINDLMQRWSDTTKTRPTAWSEATLLYNLEPDSLDTSIDRLRADHEELLTPFIERIQQSPDRRARLFTAEKG